MHSSKGNARGLMGVKMKTNEKCLEGNDQALFWLFPDAFDGPGYEPGQEEQYRNACKCPFHQPGTGSQLSGQVCPGRENSQHPDDTGVFDEIKKSTKQR